MTTSMDWKSLVRQVDKDFDRESQSPTAYEFSKGRIFKDKNPPSPGAGLTWDQLTNIRWEQMTALWENS